jgi:hypothetical protein
MIHLRWTQRIQYLVVLITILFCSPVAGVMSGGWRVLIRGTFHAPAQEVVKVADPLIQNETYPSGHHLEARNGSAIYT